MRGTIKKHSENVWYLRTSVRNEHGVRKGLHRRVRGSKAEAERAMREWVRELERGEGVDNAKMTMAEVFEAWLAEAEPNVAHKTLLRYRAIVKLHLSPLLGALRVGQIRPSHVQAALAMIRSGARRDGQAGRLSQRSVKHIYDALRAACRYGVRMQLLPRDPVASGTKAPKVERHELAALGPEDVAHLLGAADGTEFYLPVVIAAGCGLRRGELLGLKWNDVDLVTGHLSVRRSVEVVDRQLVEKETKTKRSARKIALAAFVVEALKRHHAAQKEMLLGLGVPRESTWVFLRPTGEPWIPDQFSFGFREFVHRSHERAGTPLTTFHGLRHSYATIGLLAGVDLKTISSALGHSAIAITADTYSHVLDAVKRDAADKIGSVFDRAIAGEADTVRVKNGKKAASLPQKPLFHKGLDVAPTGFETANELREDSK